MAGLEPWELFALVLGDSLPSEHIFSISTAASDSVADLKPKVYALNLSRFKDVDASGLVLWKLNNPLAVGKVDETVAALGDLSAVAEKMVPLNDILDYFPTIPQPKHLHIIVEAPDSGLKRKRSADPDDAESMRKRKRASNPLCVADISTSTTRRESTVRALYERLNYYRFVLVCGTPASGKSTLAQLLWEYIRSVEPSVNLIVIDSWLESHRRWSERLPENYNIQGPNIVIIDEAQSTYWDTGIWHSFFKPIIRGATPNRVILFASYGSARDRASVEGTTVIIPDRMRVSLQPVDHGDQIPPAGLFFTHEEFTDMVERAHPSEIFEQDFLDYVFRITSGHAGAVTDFLSTVNADNSYKNVKCEGKRYSLEIFHSECPIENLWSGLQRRSIFRRGLPMLYELQEQSTTRLFRAVLTNNSVTETMLNSMEDKNALQQCFKHGWLHATMMQDHIVYIFTTPLHRWFVEYYLGTRVADFTPTMGQHLPTFATDVSLA